MKVDDWTTGMSAERSCDGFQATDGIPDCRALSENAQLNAEFGMLNGRRRRRRRGGTNGRRTAWLRLAA